MRIEDGVPLLVFGLAIGFLIGVMFTVLVMRRPRP